LTNPALREKSSVPPRQLVFAYVNSFTTHHLFAIDWDGVCPCKLSFKQENLFLVKGEVGRIPALSRNRGSFTRRNIWCQM